MDSSLDLPPQFTTALPSTSENIFLILSVILASGCGALSTIQLSAQCFTCLASWRSAVVGRSCHYWLHTSHALLSLLTALTVLPAIVSVAEPPSHQDSRFSAPDSYTLLHLVPVTLLATNCHCLLQVAFAWSHNHTKRPSRRTRQVALVVLLLLQWIGCCTVATLACCSRGNAPACIAMQCYLSFIYCPHHVHALMDTVGWMLVVEVLLFSLLVLARVLKVRQSSQHQRSRAESHSNNTQHYRAQNHHLQPQEAQPFLDSAEQPEKSTRLLVTLTSTENKYRTNSVEDEQRRGADPLSLCCLQLIVTAIIDFTHIGVGRKNLEDIYGSTRTSNDTYPNWTSKGIHDDEEVGQQVFCRLRWLVLVQVGCRFLLLVASLLLNQVLGEHVIVWLQKQCCCCRGHNLVRPLPVTVSEIDGEIEESTTRIVSGKHRQHPDEIGGNEE